MAASGYGSPGTPGGYRPVEENADPQDRELLDRVLQQTLARISEGELFEAPDMRALQEVARQHRGQPLTLEPVALALVQAGLRAQLGSIAETPKIWQPLTIQVARMLVEDPVAFERLQRFWDRLCSVS